MSLRSRVNRSILIATVKSESESRSVVSDSWWPHGLYSPWNSPGQNTGVGSLSLLQGIFPTQGSNTGLLHCRWILYHLTNKGSPRNTGVGSLSLLQWIFLTQESNQGLLHSRPILYKLSYQGSHCKMPKKKKKMLNIKFLFLAINIIQWDWNLTQAYVKLLKIKPYFL